MAIELVRRGTDHVTIGTECERVQELQILLYHTHAPTLAKADLIEFDAACQTVKLTDAGAEIINLLGQLSFPSEEAG